ncbi:CgeB family protein [Sphingobacterium corticibacter]|uniref:Lipopolysaccharide biosynthesis protein n=1 Tax=Sphingobacterium corticibacter TaxID=2171749 RepID=A0A2T8HJN3_9SPHI|nr:lipopolysaccharide biosynthesis protein [Sphingobacterium corticibacter]PVH25603.1 lipopolysaccharide biosynthesis protein [Sphingobacterium corticibacter]
MDLLNNKSILILSVKFFNYENLIKEELTQMGAYVDIYDERPSNSFLSKVVIRLKKDLYRTSIKRYYEKLMEKLQFKSYDYFLLIKGEAIPSFFIDFLRENNENIKMIYYTYDSFKNNKNGLNNLHLFDSSYTFDRKDAISYGINFRPLFFAGDYASLYRERDDLKYTVAFIGTAHSDRYSISERVRQWCESNGKNMFAFYFSPSELLFYINRLIKKSFRGFRIRHISFHSLSHLEIKEIYRRSVAILDINHPDQDGLTMRTFETLGAGRKLITTNPNIKKYPFYNTQNVMIIDREQVDFDPAFFETEFLNFEPQLYAAMSLRGWLEEVFDLRKSNYWEKVLKD